MLIPHWINQLKDIPTPCYLVDKAQLKKNLAIFSALKRKTDCTIILALKAMSTHALFPVISTTLDGVTASSIYEARLGLEEFNGNVHVHSIAMTKNEAKQYNRMASHISFNSKRQHELFLNTNSSIHPSIGWRINPNVSSAPVEKYDPCAPYSRLGIPIGNVSPSDLKQIDGLHFHALCEQKTTPLFNILDAIELTYGDALCELKWMNWGGGHRICDPDYNIDALANKMNNWKYKYGINIIIEPGDAVIRNAGVYVSRVLDIIDNEKLIAICDISPTAHMPDILEYPYRPNVMNAGPPNTAGHNYILAGNTCLAGDVVGEYSFDSPLGVNDPVIFTDMGQYTLVKTSNFNGVNQPSVGIIDEHGSIELKSTSSYFNFKERLS
jgi:carboxynorspermidine decarboxylase